MEARHLLNELLDRSTELLGRVNPAELCSNLEKSNGMRPGLALPAFNYLKSSYGPEANLIIEPPSSDEATDPEQAPPSMTGIVDSLLDGYMACITVTHKAGPLQT
jgi:hypothetical protein